MQTAQRLVELERSLDKYEDTVADLKRNIAALKDKLLTHIENGEFPASSKINGASVHIHSQVWASPAEGNHGRLAAVLQDLGLVEYLPSKVNSQSISAYVREFLDDDTTKELDDRLAALDPRLRDALKITERVQVKVTGA